MVIEVQKEILDHLSPLIPERKCPSIVIMERTIILSDNVMPMKIYTIEDKPESGILFLLKRKLSELIQINKLSIDEWTQELTKIKKTRGKIHKRPVEEIIKSVQLDILFIRRRI